MPTGFSEADIIGRGQFADVFALSDGGRVCKLYRAQGSAEWREWAPRIHAEEILAYDRARQVPELAAHVPGCHGGVAVAGVRGATGEDLSNQYLLQLGILLERIDGPEEKAVVLEEDRYPHVWKLIRAFELAGIDVGDASAINFESLTGVKFIDITTGYGACIVAEVI